MTTSKKEASKAGRELQSDATPKKRRSKAGSTLAKLPEKKPRK